MNRAQLREAVYDRLGVTSADGQFTSQVVDRLLNDALHLIEVEHDWPWLQATASISAVAGTGSYAVPSDWLRTRYLRIDTYQPFVLREIGDLEERWPDSTTRGRPDDFAIEGDAVLIRPIPDASYTITHRYVKREPDLTDDTQSPLMPASFHAAIAERAAYLGLRRSREEGRAQVCLQAYQEWQGRMVDDRRRTQGPLRVKIRPGSAY